MIFDDPTYESNVYLHTEFAQLRHKCVANVAYTVDLLLPKGDWYTGKVTVTFDLVCIPERELALDFRGMKLG